MSSTNIFNPKDTPILFGYNEKFNFFKNLILKDKLPKVIMLSGQKGIGKSTLINHLMHFFFDKNNYNENEFSININSSFNLQFKKNLHPNIIYLEGSDFKGAKIDDIRTLKNNLSKTPINRKKRFIILDDVETFNLNSINALLKIIEEPSKNNYFILINNKTKNLRDTIRSRCLEIKIIFNDKQMSAITSLLMKTFKQNISLDIDLLKISAGRLLTYNYFINQKNINIDDNYVDILRSVLNIYKKEKNFPYKDFLLFISEYYFKKDFLKGSLSNENFLLIRLFLAKKINDFFLYNLSQNTLLSSIENKFK